MDENPKDIQEPQKTGRKSLAELMQEAEVEAQKYEAGGVSSDGVGLQMASLQETSEEVNEPSNVVDSSPNVRFGGEEVSEETLEIPQEKEKNQEEALNEQTVVKELVEEVSRQEVDNVDTGVSMEEIERELRQSQVWEEEEKRKERRKKLRKVPLLPIVLSVLFVLFTTLFFTNPGGSFTAPLQLRFLATVIEGEGRVFAEHAEEVTERRQLRVGDRVQTYEREATIEFFDKSRLVLQPETQIEIRGLSRDQKRIQVALHTGQVWVDDQDVRTTLEIFAHTQAAGKEVEAFYRSLLGTYLVTRSDEMVDVYAVTAPLYVILEKESLETMTLIPPYAAARVVDSQLRPNIFDLEYSKAKTEFRIRSYLQEYQKVTQCSGESCGEPGIYGVIQKYIGYSLGYGIQLQMQGELLVRGVALGQSSLKVMLQEWFPYLTLSQSKVEREKFLHTLHILAVALEDVVDAPTNPALRRVLEETLVVHIPDFTTWERVRPLFIVVDNALPTDSVYEVKMLLDTFEMGLMTDEQRILALQDRFIERNNEFYRLLLRNNTEYIVGNLPAYIDEVHRFVADRPAAIHLMEDARILADNMLIAVPKLYETSLFAERFKLEELELQLVESGRRDPLRLEFARMKIDVMQQLFREITTTTNAYLRQLYIARMDQLIAQFDELNIGQITFAVGPVHVLQSEFTALRRDYQTLRGVAPSEDMEALRDTTKEVLEGLENRPVGRVPQEVVKTEEQLREELRTKALKDLREVGLGLRIVSQDQKLARVFSVTGTVVTTSFTALYNAEAESFSQITMGTQRIATVVDKRYMTVFMENAAKPKAEEVDTGVTTEQRNYYREQLQVARRQRVYDLLLRNNVQVARVSDIVPHTSDATDLFRITKATTTLILPVADGKEGLTTERSFILQFSGVYNIQNDTIRDITVATSGYGSLPVTQEIAVTRLVQVIQKQFTDMFYKETYLALARKLLSDQGVVMEGVTLDASGEQFTVYKIPLVAIEVSGTTDPIMLQGNLDVVSGNLFELQWTYQNKPYTQLMLPVQELRATMQQMLRTIQEERERQLRLEQERQRQVEEERIRKQREEQQRQFENEALQFFEGTSRN